MLDDAQHTFRARVWAVEGEYLSLNAAFVEVLERRRMSRLTPWVWQLSYMNERILIFLR